MWGRGKVVGYSRNPRSLSTIKVHNNSFPLSLSEASGLNFPVAVSA
jgi:hypothetical protein